MSEGLIRRLTYGRALKCSETLPLPSIALKRFPKVGFLRDPAVEDEKDHPPARRRSGGGKSANAKAVAAAAKGKKRQAAQVSV